jgi:branched-chain amino acid transport system substrate-binding protein
MALLLTFGLIVSACSQRADEETSTGGGGDGGGSEGAGALPTEDCPETSTAGIEDGTIKLVSSFPQSGLTAAFAEISRGYKAYFAMINEQGGVEVNGEKYQIEVEDMDDEYNPGQTANNIRELVGDEGDGAFAIFNVVGTANNIAIRDFGELCVPNAFAATGSPTWGNPEYPWLIGSTLAPYTLESYAFAEHLKAEQPQAKVAMLVQDDDFGEAYEQTFRQAIDGTEIEVVAVEKYEVGASDVQAQVTSLASSGADVFFNGATLLACPGALQAAVASNWERAATYVSGTCISKTLMGIAGEDADGVVSVTNVKDPQNPAYAEDEAMAEYREMVAKYQPEADLDNGIVAYGWTQGALLVKALEATPELDRASFMQTLRTLDGVTGGLLIDGVSVTTDADSGDLFMGETVQMVQYDAANAYFTNLGEPFDYEGQTVDLTPEDLINR